VNIWIAPARNEIKPARGFEKGHGFFLCDTETTGLDPSTDFVLEVGGLFVTSDWVIRGYCNMLVLPDPVREKLKVNGENWAETEWERAAEIHQIEGWQLMEAGNEIAAAKDLAHAVKTFRKRYYLHKVILLSDNGAFEQGFLKKMFENGGERWPFHYAAWDTNLLLSSSNVGDPLPDHRAFTDSTLLYNHILCALSRRGLIPTTGR